MRRLAIYPGTFDPPTNGHLSIIERGLTVFDGLVVAIANNPKKTPMFSVEERKAFFREALGTNKRIELDSFDGLLVDYARARGIKVMLRGLRAVSDFEYEFQLANMNRKLARELDTVFMMTGEDEFYIASTLVREVASFGGRVDELVPACVARALADRFGAPKAVVRRGSRRRTT
jgi:pantetheine-phosphate adenylyltransferase